jgi:MFS transporter, CP family, cyanate transporter
MGLLIDATGYPAAIVVLLLAGAVQGVAIWRIGDRPAAEDKVSSRAERRSA